MFTGVLLCISLFLCIWYITSEEGPPSGGDGCAHILVHLAPFLLFSTWWKRPCFCGGSPFLANWRRKRIGRIASDIVALVVVSCLLSYFVWGPPCVYGPPAAWLWCPIVFLLLQINVARPFSALCVFLADSWQVVLCFSCLGKSFSALGIPPYSFSASQIHYCTHLCQLAPPDHQISSK